MPKGVEHEQTFWELMDRVRQGDESAAADLVHRFEPEVRREVRTWIRRQRAQSLHRAFDSADICQSVLARFFTGLAAGRLDLRSPDHLRNLLLFMARNSFLQHARSNRAQRRDLRRTVPLAGDDPPEPPRRESPADLAAEHELLELIRARLTPEERELADRRSQGQGWADIVAVMGGTPAGRRMQLCRAEARIVREFGLAEEGLQP
jgi:DNA-directed RNA polymerase specialized sigma24 family protein